MKNVTGKTEFFFNVKVGDVFLFEGNKWKKRSKTTAEIISKDFRNGEWDHFGKFIRVNEPDFRLAIMGNHVVSDDNNLEYEQILDQLWDDDDTGLTFHQYFEDWDRQAIAQHVQDIVADVQTAVYW